MVVRNKLAENCEKYLKKETRFIEGRIKTRQWEQEGQKRYSTEIHVYDMTFLSNLSADQKSQSQEKSSSSIQESANDDDLPF